MDFSDVIGQERIIKSLQNTIKNESIGHGYIFEGKKGIGKTMMAKIFSKALLCKEKGINPCGVCNSCIKFESFNHPDFHMEKPLGKSFKKEQIEDIQRGIRVLPYEGDRKIFIISDADKMTISAQNSFLKSLEEPPKDTIIIMMVENTKNLLPTIISRSQRLKFTPIRNDKIQDYLNKKYNIDKDKAHMIADFSRGNIGRAREICESEEFNQIRESLIDVINNNIGTDSFKSFTNSDFFENNKDEIDNVLDMMLVWFRDLLIYKETNNNELIINRDKEELLKEQSFKLSMDKIHDIINCIMETEENIRANVNFQLAIELMLLKFQEV
ncbi:DNA polymerase III subunit delta' [Clostridium sp. D2Q-14]|uniref:DNA polymerase III subunit delta' n=1 Tax=Anaeromonas gelatinilytica TaxID=2683194 RepID=UPI00193C0D7C|nr:DNA polymerase III subunit delta' [Anaeromonas gelatinilytica]MBS4535914.1 DNA polymerase III subunit delta' [Anaeromonas gelatinilytica]